MKGHRFFEFKPEQKGGNKFEQLLNIFQQLLLIFSGDVSQALSYLNDLDRQYKLTDDSYGMADFIDDLKKQGYITETNVEGELRMTAKSEQNIRKQSLDEIFGKLKRSKSSGNHHTPNTGVGDELSSDFRPFQFGDTLDQISMTESLKNAQINSGIEDFRLLETDLEVVDRESKIQTSTVLMIDISHSMILYGEDRITPAKKVALAMAELIRTKYPKDTLDILVFGNDAWQIQLKDIPYLEVGPIPHQYGGRFRISNGFTTQKKNQKQTDFYDYGWKTYVFERRNQVL